MDITGAGTSLDGTAPVGTSATMGRGSQDTGGAVASGGTIGAGMARVCAARITIMVSSTPSYLMLKNLARRYLRARSTLARRGIKARSTLARRDIKARRSTVAQTWRIVQLIRPRRILRPHSNPTDRASEVGAVVAARRASEVEVAAAVEAAAAGEVVTEQ